VKRRDRRQAFGLPNAFESFDRDVAEHAGRLLAHGFVRVRLCHAGERGRIHQFGDRRTADPCVGILASDFGEQIALVERNLLDKAQSDGGVDVLLTGLGAESIEQCHSRSSLTRAGQLVTRFSSMERRTPKNLCTRTYEPRTRSANSCSRSATSAPWDSARTFLSMSRMRPSRPM